MSTGYILILAVLLLGGVIATVGDRIGTRVGKARLSLFNLRPRKTATLVTILTGTMVAASTLGILFAASEYLRTGVFELDRIQSRLRRSRAELEQAREQKTQAETELTKAQADRTSAQKQLGQTRQQLQETGKSLQTAIQERSRAQSERLRTEVELNRIQSQLRAEINQLETEKQRLIAQKEAEIGAKETQVRQLETQQVLLAREVQRLELERQGLRQGNVVIQRGQVLASAVVRNLEPVSAQQVVQVLLNQANREAIRLARPGSKDQVIQITRLDVEQLIGRIDDGKEYVVRIISAANYLVGEPIQVFSDTVRNQVVFKAGDVVAASNLDLAKISDGEIQQRIGSLLVAAGFRARNLGLLTDAVEIDRRDLLNFIGQLRQYNQVVELKAVAADITYTANPLKVELLAAQNGKILFRSKPSPATTTQ